MEVFLPRGTALPTYIGIENSILLFKVKSAYIINALNAIGQ